jgi:hypothetical protein
MPQCCTYNLEHRQVIIVDEIYYVKYECVPLAIEIDSAERVKGAGGSIRP